jgi:putative AbiEi antitoxin of type IV toxin-antitoxin system
MQLEMAGITQSRLAEVAQDQWGLLTRQQAEATGVSRATLQRLSSDHVLERVAHGVYHLAGAPEPEHLQLRAAWLQLAPDVPAWKRRPDEGVVSHRSAAALLGLGHLPADQHNFILPARRQTRRPDVRLHQRVLGDAQWNTHQGLPVTRPARIAFDLLDDREDPEAVAHVVADAIRGGLEHPARVAEALVPIAPRLGFRRGDGLGGLRYLLELVAHAQVGTWLEEARTSLLRDPSRP